MLTVHFFRHNINRCHQFRYNISCINYPTASPDLGSTCNRPLCKLSYPGKIHTSAKYTKYKEAFYFLELPGQIETHKMCKEPIFIGICLFRSLSQAVLHHIIRHMIALSQLPFRLSSHSVAMHHCRVPELRSYSSFDLCTELKIQFSFFPWHIVELLREKQRNSDHLSWLLFLVKISLSS